MKTSIIKTSFVLLSAAAALQSCSPTKHISDYVVNNKVEQHVTSQPDTTSLTKIYKVKDRVSQSYLEVSKYKDKSGEHIVFASDAFPSCGYSGDAYAKVKYHIMTIERAKQVRNYCQTVEEWEKFIPLESGKPKMEQTEINYQISEGVFISFMVSYQYEVVNKEDGGQQGRLNAFIDEMDLWLDGRRHRVHIDSFVKSLQGLGDL
ncbi:MAG: hypothetical protein RL060_219 [Bacteroidota bacterium]